MELNATLVNVEINPTILLTLDGKSVAEFKFNDFYPTKVEDLDSLPAEYMDRGIICNGDAMYGRPEEYDPCVLELHGDEGILRGLDYVPTESDRVLCWTLNLPRAVILNLLKQIYEACADVYEEFEEYYANRDGDDADDEHVTRLMDSVAVLNA